MSATTKQLAALAADAKGAAALVSSFIDVSGPPAKRCCRLVKACSIALPRILAW